VRFHAAEWHIDPHKIGVPRIFRQAGICRQRSARILRSVDPAVDACEKKAAAGLCGTYLSGTSVAFAAEWDAKQGTKKFVVRHPRMPIRSWVESRCSCHHQPDAAYIFAGRRGCHVDKRRRLTGLLHCSEEGWVPWRAFVCAGRACVWAAAARSFR